MACDKRTVKLRKATRTGKKTSCKKRRESKHTAHGQKRVQKRRKKEVEREQQKQTRACQYKSEERKKLKTISSTP